MAGSTVDEAVTAIARSIPSKAEDHSRWGSYDEGDDDALIVELKRTGHDIRTARHRMRLLLAYAREYQGRRPYPLSWLAEATGMSASGIRTAYGSDDVARVAEILGTKVPHQR